MEIIYGIGGHKPASKNTVSISPTPVDRQAVIDQLRQYNKFSKQKTIHYCCAANNTNTSEKGLCSV